MDYNRICYKCFTEIPIIGRPCPNCNYNNSTPQMSPNCLKSGTILANRYIVGVALGVGGFGITYKCFDTQIGGVCAIKEYFPSIFAVRNNNYGTIEIHSQKLERFKQVMNRFVDEAKLLRTLDYVNIIKVYDLFFANKTAYYAMEYCDGIDLRRYTNDFKRKLDYREGMNIMYQVMNGLEYIHAKGILHRDIAPDNIYITQKGVIKILDFGSARHELDQLNREFSVVIKAGYAPIEQYGGKIHQGMYTDIYAFGATMYHMFCGVMPIESISRIENDRLVPFSALRPDLPDRLKYCIEKCMRIQIKDRIQDVQEIRQILQKKDPLSKYIKQETRKNIGEQEVSYVPEKASIELRLCACLFDYILYGLIYSMIIYFAVSSARLSMILWCMLPIVVLIINVITESVSGTTIGKKIMGIRVIGRNSGSASKSQIVLRNIIKLLNVFTLIFGKNGYLLQDTLTESVVCKN